MKNFKFKWTTLFIIWFVSMVSIVTLNIYYSIPSAEKIKGCFTTRMHQVELCPKNGNYVSLGNISPHLKNAILISEDSGFYQHNGFEIAELKESLKTNLERGTFARGGSTISQQLARNLFLTSEKSLFRKFKEALITYRLEATLSKNEIFERYLNVVEFGKNIYGVKEAARYYFGKSPADLNVLEASYLAFLLPSPVKYSVSFHKKSLTSFANKRIHQILYRMFAYHKISEEEYQYARSMVKYFPWRDLESIIPEPDIPTADALAEPPDEAVIEDLNQDLSVDEEIEIIEEDMSL